MEKAKTEELLIESLKRLALKKSFEKITIRDITDEAGLIRSTFYNHFSDKYALLEAIFYRDVVEPSVSLAEDDLFFEALRLILRNIEKERNFYKRLIRNDPNGNMRRIVVGCFQRLIRSIVERVRPEYTARNEILTPDSIAEYYAVTLIFVMEKWLGQEREISADEVADMLLMMSMKPLSEVLRR